MNLPIGSIIAWHKSFANTPDLPPGWVECNGGTLDNEDSPYHGQVIPNLNGNGHFLRGSSVSGTVQGDQITSHKHPHTTYDHGIVDNYNNTGKATTSTVAGSDDSGNAVVTAGSTVVGSETRPKNTSVVWIMRVSNTRHESRLLNLETEDVHVNIGPKPGGDPSDPSVGATKAPVSEGSGKGTMVEGVVWDGKRPIACVKVGALNVGGTPRSITPDDRFEIVFSYALMSSRLGEPFVFADTTFYLWDLDTEAWVAIAAEKGEVTSKLLAGAATSEQLGAVIKIFDAEPGEYIVIGAVQA